eukprot:TRINITY_DN5648_c0_g1_i1.p1 TRINITY_DN5648_c0_g1~~TRINITY_DN5648_c0_g1_i1.p1  ORF type:complete len:345 (-),score=92.56 TRINITY_DN5648_c0_g1_i1:35-1069(-)
MEEVELDQNKIKACKSKLEQHLNWEFDKYSLALDASELDPIKKNKFREIFENIQNDFREIQKLDEQLTALRIKKLKLKEIRRISKQNVDIERETNLEGPSIFPYISLSKDEIEVPATLEGCLKEIFPNDDAYKPYKGDLHNFSQKRESWNPGYLGEKELRDIEIESIFIYTLELPLPSKQFQIYTNLNKTLTSPQRDKELTCWRFYLYHFFKGFRKLPVFDLQEGQLYRGVGLDLLKHYPEKYQEGKKITFYAFSSFSTKRNKAKEWCKDTGTLFTVYKSCLSGRRIAKLSIFPSEDEILFPPGATFAIEQIRSEPNGITTIFMKQVPSIDRELAKKAAELGSD